MKKTNILNIGLGQCGNNLIDYLQGLDKRYTSLYINSAYADMANLNYINLNTNAFIFPGATGSGRNKALAEKMAKDNIHSLMDTFNRYQQKSHVELFVASDGGTGAGITKIVIQLLRKLNKTINVNAVIPNLAIADKVALENCISFIKDLTQVRKLFDGLRFIDNSKRGSYKEVNEEALNLINSSFDIVNTSYEGSIDERDSYRINTHMGYTMTLNLSNDFDNLDNCIEKAFNESVFALPNSFKCDYLGINVSKKINKNDILKKFEVYEKTWFTENETDKNIITLSGCDIPGEIQEKVKLALEDKEAIKSKRFRNDIIDLDIEINKQELQENNINAKTNLSMSDLDSLIEDIL